MSIRMRLLRTVLFIFAFFGVLGGGMLIGQMRGHMRHMENALDSLRSARHSIGEAMRDRPTPSSRAAMDHIDRAIRDVQEDLH
jgi:hypothetical protein